MHVNAQFIYEIVIFIKDHTFNFSRICKFVIIFIFFKMYGLINALSFNIFNVFNMN